MSRWELYRRASGGYRRPEGVKVRGRSEFSCSPHYEMFVLHCEVVKVHDVESVWCWQALSSVIASIRSLAANIDKLGFVGQELADDRVNCWHVCPVRLPRDSRTPSPLPVQPTGQYPTRQ